MAGKSPGFNPSLKSVSSPECSTPSGPKKHMLFLCSHEDGECTRTRTSVFFFPQRRVGVGSPSSFRVFLKPEPSVRKTTGRCKYWNAVRTWPASVFPDSLQTLNCVRFSDLKDDRIESCSQTPLTKMGTKTDNLKSSPSAEWHHRVAQSHCGRELKSWKSGAEWDGMLCSVGSMAPKALLCERSQAREKCAMCVALGRARIPGRT